MASSKIIVIDASIALKWFLIEEFSDLAIELRNYCKKIIPLVPSLFYYEICNVLRYKKEFGIESVIRALDSLEKFQFKIEDFKGDYAQKSIELAFTYGITVYDAAYVALSEIAKTFLITADEKLINKVARKEIIHIQFLDKLMQEFNL